jgi:hypothetical protein
MRPIAASIARAIGELKAAGHVPARIYLSEPTAVLLELEVAEDSPPPVEIGGRSRPFMGVPVSSTFGSEAERVVAFDGHSVELVA